MKRKIAILGSTGSIGKNLLKILEKEKSNFEILLLTANKNYKVLFNQINKYNVKNIIITDKLSYKILVKKLKNKNVNIYNDYSSFNLIFKKKIDYVMSSISGIDGLIPTIRIIKYTKKIAIANKETIICSWNIIKNELKKNKTIFIPVDSEHFSLWYAIQNLPSNKIERIYLTASGGPFLNFNKKKLKKINISQALKHPNWKMGKKISIDSSTLMNKVFEVIEAKHIFELPYKKISILTHPSSYVHALVKFSNGLIKIIAHDTTMKIPIFNTIFTNDKKKIDTKEIDIIKLNTLNLRKVDIEHFPSIKILKKMPEKISLYESVIISANDRLVNLFLEKKIKYNQIVSIMLKLINYKVFLKYKKLTPKKIEDIISVKNHVGYEITKLLKL